MSGKKTVLISGCSSGLGLELAKQFCLAGYHVIATARNPEVLSSLKSSDIDILQLDVTDSSSIRKCIDSAIGITGRIDILINNAGVALIGPVSELDPEMLKKQFDTNFFGAVDLSQAVIPQMIKRKSGRIVHISSISGIVTTPFAGAYCSSKSALSSIADAMRMELKPFGISVMDVQPGKIKSSFGNNAKKGAAEHHRADSNYKSIAHFIDKRAEISQESPSSAAEIASIIVKKTILKNPPARIRIGKESFKLPLLKLILPTIVLDSLLSKIFGLNLLKPSIMNRLYERFCRGNKYK